MKPTKAKPKRINPYYAFGGAIIPNWLMRRAEVSGAAKLVFAVLAEIGQNGDPVCVFGPVQSDHAAATGLTLKRWVLAVNELHSHGLLSWDEEGIAEPKDDNGWREAGLYDVAEAPAEDAGVQS